MRSLEQAKIAVMGLGYVGLPLAVAFGKCLPTIGFDTNRRRIEELRRGRDGTLEVEPEELAGRERLRYTDDVRDLAGCNTFIVTVPTPIDEYKQPDLGPLERASRMLAGVLKAGDVAIYESTVYPGATEEVCVPILERVSGLRLNREFFVGYSPERINPGDKDPSPGRHRQGDLGLDAGVRGLRRRAVSLDHRRRAPTRRAASASPRPPR